MDADAPVDRTVVHREIEVTERHRVRRRRRGQDQGEEKRRPAQQYGPHRADRVAAPGAWQEAYWNSRGAKSAR
jgi:hypothetical protein